jgi:hypothetical protein
MQTNEDRDQASDSMSKITAFAKESPYKGLLVATFATLELMARSSAPIEIKRDMILSSLEIFANDLASMTINAVVGKKDLPIPPQELLSWLSRRPTAIKQLRNLSQEVANHIKGPDGVNQ